MPVYRSITATDQTPSGSERSVRRLGGERAAVVSGGGRIVPVVELDLYFTEYFDVDPDMLEEYGAFDISVVSDLPLFIDPFLLFNSDDPTYQQLHQQILDYLVFLRDCAAELDLDPDLIDAWYRFKEVRQNWLGFTVFGNGGAGLGQDFARALRAALGDIFRDFGAATVTRGTHLEKLCLRACARASRSQPGRRGWCPGLAVLVALLRSRSLKQVPDLR
jgi:hypothetical protein